MTSSNKSKMANGGHIEFRKIWYKDVTQPRAEIPRDQTRNPQLTWRHHSNVWNKCGWFSAIIRYIWMKFDTQYSINRELSRLNVLNNSFIVKIQDDGGRHIEFRKMSVSLRQTTGNDYKTGFSLHVVENVCDDYNCQFNLCGDYCLVAEVSQHNYADWLQLLVVIVVL